MPPRKITKVLTIKEALRKAQNYCLYQERSHHEVRQKLYDWGLHKQDVEETISALIEQGFVNELRFAVTFADSKFRLKKWGRIKIERELQLKKISAYCIQKALKIIEEETYLDVLKKLIQKKGSQIKTKNTFERNGKIASYTIGKGFEPDLVWKVLKDED